MLVTQTAVNRALFSSSLFDAFLMCWDTINPDEYQHAGWVEPVCKMLQEDLERVLRGEKKRWDTIINVPPGTGKSSLFVAMRAWCFARDPGLKMIYASYVQTLSVRLNVKLKDILTSPWYSEMFPDVQIRSDYNLKQHFVLTAGGESLASAVGGTLTGFHAHILFWDDLLNPKQAASEANLLEVERFDEETLPSRMVNKSVTPIIGIMQRLHQNDSTGRALKKAEQGGSPLRHICLPAESSYPIKPESMIESYRDGLLVPERLSREVLDTIRANGLLAYAGQYGQQPVPREGGTFDVTKIEMLRRGEVPDLDKVVRYWDKAGSKRKTSAWTVGVKMGVKTTTRMINGESLSYRTYYILDVVRFQERAGKRERIIKQTAVSDGTEVEVHIEQEPGSGGMDSAEMTISNMAGFVVKAELPRGDKITRADAFASQVDINQVYIVESSSWNGPYLEELRLFPNSNFKDQVDASSGCFRALAVENIYIGAT